MPIAYSWGGVVDMTQDRLPRADEHDGLFYVTGLSGHGVQFSGYIGDRMARLIGGEADANPLAGNRHRPRCFCAPRPFRAFETLKFKG